MDRIRSLLALSPSKIAGIYLVLSVGWIATSDVVASWIAQTQADLTRIQTVKGWLFVVLSGLLILGLTSYRERQLETTQDRFRVVNQHLHVLHRVLRHNIRNNMNVVLGYLQLIADEGGSPVGEYAEQAREATQDFCSMAHKLRVIDEMDPTEPGNDPVNLVSVIATVIDDLESAHPTLSIESDLPVAAHVNASPSIRLVFEELLSNAIEHAEKLPGALSIEVSIDRAPDSITVCITDDGPGIHPDELAALRSGDESKLLHTSGAGLWLATWLIELFEGEIEFETDPDHGTTVVIRFHRSSKIEYMAETAQNDMRMFQSETTSSADHPGFSK